MFDYFSHLPICLLCLIVPTNASALLHGTDEPHPLFGYGRTWTDIGQAMLACATFLQGFVNFCAGCFIFGYLVKFGLVSHAVFRMHVNTRRDEKQENKNVAPLPGPLFIPFPFRCIPFHSLRCTAQILVCFVVHPGGRPPSACEQIKPTLVCFATKSLQNDCRARIFVTPDTPLCL